MTQCTLNANCRYSGSALRVEIQSVSLDRWFIQIEQKLYEWLLYFNWMLLFLPLSKESMILDELLITFMPTKCLGSTITYYILKCKFNYVWKFMGRSFSAGVSKFVWLIQCGRGHVFALNPTILEKLMSWHIVIIYYYKMIC